MTVGPRRTTLACMARPHPSPETMSEPRLTWRIPDDRRLPALDPYADEVLRLPAVTLRETVWDTSDGVLLAAGVEVVRQSDDTWTVDRGSGPEPCGGPGDPFPRDAVEVLLRGRGVDVVRVRDTTTALLVLRGKDGRARAEVADVRVDEGDPDTALLRSARWWALADDGRSGTVTRSAERALSDAADDEGAAGRGAITRLEPVARLAPVRRPSPGTTGARPRRGSAAAFVLAALVGLRAELVAVDPLVRSDERDAVHELRKVLRRLRSVLAAFRGALDRERTEDLRARLATVARVAGVVRDAEVLRDGVLRTVARTPHGYVDSATIERFRAHVDTVRASTADDLRAALSGPLWFGALDALDDLVASAPAGPHARDRAADFTTKRIERERARVRRTIERGDESVEQLHEVRKAARRLRYALEAAGDLPDVGKRRLGRLRRIQDTLGEALDAAHAADAHREVARLAAREGADTFGAGVLAATEHALVEDRAERARRLVRKP